MEPFRGVRKGKSTLRCRSAILEVTILCVGSRLWHDVVSVCLSVVCLSVCNYILPQNCLNEQIRLPDRYPVVSVWATHNPPPHSAQTGYLLLTASPNTCIAILATVRLLATWNYTARFQHWLNETIIQQRSGGFKQTATLSSNAGWSNSC